jgi:Fe-S-cluster containining protein
VLAKEIRMKVESLKGALPLAPTLHACANCPVHFVCCSVSSRGGIVDAPYLLPDDITAIAETTGLNEDEFVEHRVNTITGNAVSFVKTPESVGCRFHDVKSGRCNIYNARPLDCRLYPLDIMLIDGRYFWILREYCRISTEDIKSLLAYGQAILPFIKDQLHDYATIPLETMDSHPYQIIAPLEFEEKEVL